MYDVIDVLIDFFFIAQRERFMLTGKAFGFERDRTVRGLLASIGKTTKRKLRSLSPVKHGRKSLDGVFGGVSIGERS